MTVLVVAEHDNSTLRPSTLNAVGAAQKIGGEIHILVAGANCDAVAQAAAKIAGVIKVLKADASHLQQGLAENVAPVIVGVAVNYSHVLAPSSTYTKNFMPRAAALLDVQQISDISAVVSADTFERPVYAGNAIATVQSSDKIKIIIVRPTNFDAAPATGGSGSVESVNVPASPGTSNFVDRMMTKSERPELTAAKIVISGGRGLGSKENFAIVMKLADKLGAAVGASRAAVDAGYVPNDYQVGQTGKVVAPDLYLAIGISGAIQHLAGMKDSKVIAAINKDPEAPIFQIADYGLVADLFEAVKELESKL